MRNNAPHAAMDRFRDSVGINRWERTENAIGESHRVLCPGRALPHPHSFGSNQIQGNLSGPPRQNTPATSPTPEPRENRAIRGPGGANPAAATPVCPKPLPVLPLRVIVDPISHSSGNPNCKWVVSGSVSEGAAGTSHRGSAPSLTLRVSMASPTETMVGLMGFMQAGTGELVDPHRERT